ncbi:MAG: hypothetical protein A2Z46_03740 [Nitrospirae bacterium RBG_19FT_COMBO_55_12]|nr:MAG: hypothetical protein A2Z46_03740 [Nitrospirae bacterium RBG_19FT_COMBO_55_12]
MAEFNNDHAISGASERPETGLTVHCKLFSDEVTKQICSLRKKELNAQEGFSCEGCPQAVLSV